MSNKHGRLPPFTPTEAQRELVAILAGNGIPHEIIARCVTNPDTTLPIGKRTLDKHFADELKDGRAISDAGLINKAYSVAMSGQPAVLIFMLKTRLGWKEPAQEINLRQSYEELVRDAAKKAEEQRKAGGVALTVVEGGKAA